MSKKVLLVDDEAIIALNQAQILKEHGYETKVVHSGEAAVKTVENDPSIALICMDIDLGRGIDGTEAARRILGMRDIPIVFLSSHTERDVVEKTSAITSYGYVVKNSGDTVFSVSIQMAFRLYDAHCREKEHEEKLVNERNLLKTVIDNLPDAIYVKDTQSRKILANPADLRNMGASSEDEIRGRTDLDFFPPDIATQFLENDQEVFRTGEPVVLSEEPLVRPNGEKRWLVTTKVPFRDAKGRVIGLVGIGHDITERKKFEDALRESEQRYRNVFENTHTVMLILDPSDGSIVDANPKAAEFYGRSREQLITMRIDDLNSLPREQVMEEIRRAQNERRDFSRFRHRVADGERDVEVYSGPISFDGRDLLFSVVHDAEAKIRSETRS